MYQSEVMVLTGAGASVPLGVPAMGGMARNFADSLSSREDLFKTYELTQQLGAGPDVEEILQLCNDLINLRDSAARSLVEHAIAPRGGENVKTFRKRIRAEIDDLEKLRKRLFDFLSRACLAFDRDSAERIYGDLVVELQKCGVPIFTTNYDSSLDYAARVRDIPVVDNFVRDSHGRYFWDETYNAFQGDGLPIVKIHGSIEWHADSRGVIERIAQPATVSVESRPLKQLLIFPTRFKDIYTNNYFPLYSAFTRTLASAKTLIVVGHSLRDEYIAAAVRERLRDDEFGVVVVDPRLPECFQEVENEADGRLAHLGLSVEQATPYLVQLLREVSPSDMVDHAKETMGGIQRGRRSKVKMSKEARWAGPGDELEVTISVDTVVTDSSLILKCHPKRAPKKAKPLNYRRRTAGGSEKYPIRVFGRRKEKLDLIVALPDDLEAGMQYKLIAELRGQRGSYEARDSVSFSVPKKKRR